MTSEQDNFETISADELDISQKSVPKLDHRGPAGGEAIPPGMVHGSDDHEKIIEEPEGKDSTGEPEGKELTEETTTDKTSELPEPSIDLEDVDLDVSDKELTDFEPAGGEMMAPPPDFSDIQQSLEQAETGAEIHPDLEEATTREMPDPREELGTREEWGEKDTETLDNLTEKYEGLQENIVSEDWSYTIGENENLPNFGHASKTIIGEEFNEAYETAENQGKIDTVESEDGEEKKVFTGDPDSELGKKLMDSEVLVKLGEDDNTGEEIYVKQSKVNEDEVVEYIETSNKLDSLYSQYQREIINPLIESDVLNVDDEGEYDVNFSAATSKDLERLEAMGVDTGVKGVGRRLLERVGGDDKALHGTDPLTLERAREAIPAAFIYGIGGVESGFVNVANFLGADWNVRTMGPADVSDYLGLEGWQKIGPHAGATAASVSLGVKGGHLLGKVARPSLTTLKSGISKHAPSKLKSVHSSLTSPTGGISDDLAMESLRIKAENPELYFKYGDEAASLGSGAKTVGSGAKTVAGVLTKPSFNLRTGVYGYAVGEQLREKGISGIREEPLETGLQLGRTVAGTEAAIAGFKSGWRGSPRISTNVVDGDEVWVWEEPVEVKAGGKKYYTSDLYPLTGLDDAQDVSRGSDIFGLGERSGFYGTGPRVNLGLGERSGFYGARPDVSRPRLGWGRGYEAGSKSVESIFDREPLRRVSPGEFQKSVFYAGRYQTPGADRGVATRGGFVRGGQVFDISDDVYYVPKSNVPASEFETTTEGGITLRQVFDRDEGRVYRSIYGSNLSIVDESVPSYTGEFEKLGLKQYRGRDPDMFYSRGRFRPRLEDYGPVGDVERGLSGISEDVSNYTVQEPFELYPRGLSKETGYWGGVEGLEDVEDVVDVSDDFGLGLGERGGFYGTGPRISLRDIGIDFGRGGADVVEGAEKISDFEKFVSAERPLKTVPMPSDRGLRSVSEGLVGLGTSVSDADVGPEVSVERVETPDVETGLTPVVGTVEREDLDRVVQERALTRQEERPLLGLGQIGTTDLAIGGLRPAVDVDVGQEVDVGPAVTQIQTTETEQVAPMEAVETGRGPDSPSSPYIPRFGKGDKKPDIKRPVSGEGRLYAEREFDIRYPAEVFSRSFERERRGSVRRRAVLELLRREKEEETKGSERNDGSGSVTEQGSFLEGLSRSNNSGKGSADDGSFLKSLLER